MTGSKRWRLFLPRMADSVFWICIPTRDGGQGMDYITLGLACEELEAIDSTLRVVMSVHGTEQHGTAAVGQRGAETTLPGTAGQREIRSHALALPNQVLDRM
jgi:alkylation response protein AidB-like acyl-CoA dehydrogenase